MWELRITPSSEASEEVYLSFLGWSQGKSRFIYTHAYTVEDLGEPAVYLSGIKISESDLSTMKDDDLFSHPEFIVKYDTAEYHLLKNFAVNEIRIQVGTHKFIVKDAQLSKRVMKSIKRAKAETNIWFASVIYEGKELDISNGYDKKKRPRRSNFFEEHLGKKRAKRKSKRKK